MPNKNDFVCQDLITITGLLKIDDAFNYAFNDVLSDAESDDDINSTEQNMQKLDDILNALKFKRRKYLD